MSATHTPSKMRPRPARRLDGMTPYRAGDRRRPIDLRLDANEGAPDPSLMEALSEIDPETLRRYSDASDLGRAIADQWSIDQERVVVCAGGDDAIDRLCRVMLEPGRSLVIHTPTFVMIPRTARLAGAEVREVAWVRDAFPAADMIDAIDSTTGLVALVTPNNPTGDVIPLDAVLRITEAAAAVGAVVLVDLAYVEFASEDPTRALMSSGNVVIVRTFSKAHGLAGLRVGYAIAPIEVAGWLRTVGSPYPVSTLSLAVASRALHLGDPDLTMFAAQRARLATLLEDLGARPLPSSANFVTARFRDAHFVHEALGAAGIAVRAFPGDPALSDALRITLPGDTPSYDRLCAALRSAMAPEALLFDVDGVLADVSESYRSAIIQTARTFGVALTTGDIARAKRMGNANNDWVLTRRLLSDNGVGVSLAEVTARFQSLYLGDDRSPGLREREALLVGRDVLERIGARTRLAIVSGRPRDEAEWFLDRAGLTGLFETAVCMEDAPAKPSPEPVRLAMERLGAERAWMVGDTPDDIRAARGAGVVGLGVVAPGEDTMESTTALESAGAVRVFADIAAIEELLP